MFSFHNFSIRNSGASSGDVRKNCVYSGQGGGIICRETGLMVSVITTTRETFFWVCGYINAEGGGGGNAMT